MTFDEALAEADAPEELVEWVARLGAGPDEALGRCDRAEWLVWIVAVGGGALDDLFVAVRACVERAVDELAVGQELLVEPLAALEPGAPADACAEAARRCELAAAEFHGTYRAAPPPAYRASCAAAAALAHAGVGLATAAARADFARQEKARASAAFVGASPFAFYTPPARARFDAGLIRSDPIQQELHFVVAALALAAAEADRALAEAADALADVLRDTLGDAADPR